MDIDELIAVSIKEFLDIEVHRDTGDLDFCLLYTSPSPRD